MAEEYRIVRPLPQGMLPASQVPGESRGLAKDIHDRMKDHPRATMVEAPVAAQS